MRYREGQSEEVPAAVDQQMFLGTAAYSLVAGLLMCVLGWRSRKYWVVAIGLVLVGSSVGYLFWRGMLD